MARMEMGMDGVELAAQTGTPDALFELGMLHATGLEVETDLIVAHKWFNLAALRGNKEALARRKELALEMTAAEIAEAQKLAREWLATEKHAFERLAAERLAIEAFAAERAIIDRQAKRQSAPEQTVTEWSPAEWVSAEALAA
jgi:hypothetical protein